MAVDPLSLIALGLGLADKILERSNTNNRRKYLDQWAENEKNLLKEWNRWPDTEDNKIEDMMNLRKILVEAAQKDLQLLEKK